MMKTDQAKFFELQQKFEAKEISRLEFFTKAEELVKYSRQKPHLMELLAQAKKNK